MKRIIVSILIMTIAYTVQGLTVYAGPHVGQQPAAESSGPPLGKWQFIVLTQTSITQSSVWNWYPKVRHAESKRHAYGSRTSGRSRSAPEVPRTLLFFHPMVKV
jgi:hypothetical protein